MENLPSRLANRSRPHILADFAMTLDGKLLMRNPAFPLSTSREHFSTPEHTIESVAVLLGPSRFASLAKEIFEDAPSYLSTRDACLIICIPDGMLPTNWERILTITDKCIVFSSALMSQEMRDRIACFQQIKLELLPVYSLPTVLAALQVRFALDTVVCMDDADFLRALAEIDAVDELFLSILPQVSGDDSRPSLTGVSSNFLSQSLFFEIVERKTLKGIIYLHYRRNHAAPLPTSL